MKTLVIGSSGSTIATIAEVFASLERPPDQHRGHARLPWPPAGRDGPPHTGWRSMPGFDEHLPVQAAALSGRTGEA